MTSNDGETWTSRTSAVVTDQFAVIYDDALYIAGGTRGGATDSIQTSPDGITWTNRTTANTGQPVLGLAYGNNKIVAVGGSGAGTTGKIQLSTNGGTAWANVVVANVNTIYAVGYGNGTFVAVGRAGSIQTSVNGTSWTNRTTANTEQMNGVAYGNGTFVAVGGGGAVQTSANGTTWTNRATPDDLRDLYAIIYANNQFVAVGQETDDGGPSKNVFTSPDGITWTLRTAAVGARNTQRGVAFGAGVFVSVGDGPTAQYSTNNAVTWANSTPSVAQNLNAVTF
jgi:hypothetical protein